MTIYSKYIDLQIIFDGYQHNGKEDGDDFQDEFHQKIDTYIGCEDQDIVKKIVDKYGVFKALKDYTCEYSAFNFDEDLSFLKTYGTLADYIINEYIQDNISLITDYLEENNVSKADTDTEE